MSDLWWVTPENQLSRAVCHRNGCRKPPEWVVKWGRYLGETRACPVHAAWWCLGQVPGSVTVRKIGML